jgi:hypothetical protein
MKFRKIEERVMRVGEFINLPSMRAWDGCFAHTTEPHKHGWSSMLLYKSKPQPNFEEIAPRLIARDCVLCPEHARYLDGPPPGYRWSSPLCRGDGPMPIIPLEALEPDPRAMLGFDIAQTIETALSGPAEIGVLEVAEMILAHVDESQIFRVKARVRVPAKSRLVHAG